MKYKALANFATPRRSFQKGQFYNLDNNNETKDFLKCGYIEEVKEVKRGRSKK